MKSFTENIIRKHSLAPIPLVWLKVGDLEQIHIYDDWSLFPEGGKHNLKRGYSHWQWLKVEGDQIEIWRRIEYRGKVYGPQKIKPFAVFEPTEWGWQAAIILHKQLDIDFVNRICGRDSE